MANHQDRHTPTGRGPGYTQVSSRLHGAGQDVGELLDVLTAGLDTDHTATGTATDTSSGSSSGTIAGRQHGHSSGPGERR